MPTPQRLPRLGTAPGRQPRADPCQAARVRLRYALVLLVALELAVLEAFLVAARPFGIALPLSATLAAVGNAVLGRAGARVLRRPLGAAVPGLVWLGVALSLGTRGPGGDTVVTNTWRGIAFLVAGGCLGGRRGRRHGRSQEQGYT